MPGAPTCTAPQSPQKRPATSSFARHSFFYKIIIFDFNMYFFPPFGIKLPWGSSGALHWRQAALAWAGICNWAWAIPQLHCPPVCSPTPVPQPAQKWAPAPLPKRHLAQRSRRPATFRRQDGRHPLSLSLSQLREGGRAGRGGQRRPGTGSRSRGRSWPCSSLACASSDGEGKAGSTGGRPGAALRSPDTSRWVPSSEGGENDE